MHNYILIIYKLNDKLLPNWEKIGKIGKNNILK